VCVCVCVLPKILGQPREVKIGLIMLKFSTPVYWMNTSGQFFHFLKIFLVPKALGQPRELTNGPTMLKFGILIDRMNT